ncbi:hypothetical protein D3C84_401830 [compost metagenome]
MADSGLHAVGAGGGRLDHDITGVVHHIGVVAEATGQSVGAAAAVEQVVRGIAGDRVGQGIARAVDGGRAGQGQVLHVGRQHMADGGLHAVGAAGRSFHHDIAGVVHHIGIVAQAADQAVGAGGAVEDVVRRVAGDLVGQGVAGAVDGDGAGQGQVLQFGTEDVGDGGLHGVRAATRGFHHDVTCIVDHEDVVAQATHHAVGAQAADQLVRSRAAVEDVVRRVAGDQVGQGVAGAVDGGGAGQGQVLQLGAEDVAEGRLHGIDAAARRLDHDVGGVVHHVGVVAQPTHQAVDPGAAVEDVVRGVAGDLVGQGVAGAIDGGRADQGQVLHFGAEGEAGGGLHGIGATARRLDHDVGGVVHHVGVVAQPTHQAVDPGAAVEDVVRGVAGDLVGQGVAGAVDGGRAGEEQVLEVGAEGMGDRRKDAVHAGGGGLGHAVGRAVDDIGVIAGTAIHDVGAGGADQHIVAGAAGERVGHRGAAEHVRPGGSGQGEDRGQGAFAVEDGARGRRRADHRIDGGSQPQAEGFHRFGRQVVVEGHANRLDHVPRREPEGAGSADVVARQSGHRGAVGRGVVD